MCEVLRTVPGQHHVTIIIIWGFFLAMLALFPLNSDI